MLMHGGFVNDVIWNAAVVQPRPVAYPSKKITRNLQLVNATTILWMIKTVLFGVVSRIFYIHRTRINEKCDKSAENSTAVILWMESPIVIDFVDDLAKAN